MISSWEYAYDDVGNVSSQTDKDSMVTSYTYDDIYELSYVNYPSGSDYGYEYDAVGNRLKMLEYTASTITTTYTYDDADELTEWTTSTVTMTFGYASDGCLSTKSDGTDMWTYEWDYERRLKAFKENGATLVEYTYNPTGTRRYSSDSTLGLTNYFYSGNHVLADCSSNWSLDTSYVLGANAMVDRTTDPDTAYYLTRDRLRSTREIVNSAQTVNTRYDYDAWGDPTEMQLIGSVSTRYRMQGREWSEATGLGVTRGGWYSPVEARRLKSAQAGTGAPRVGVWSHFYPSQPIDPGDINPLDCMRVCEGQWWTCMNSCGNRPGCMQSWTLGLCGRCCQCWFKRCFGGCADLDQSNPNNRLMIWYDDFNVPWDPDNHRPGGFAFPGGPDWGDNFPSIARCPGDLCGVPDFAPAVYPGIDSMDDASVNGTNVCASLVGIHVEWNALWHRNPFTLVEFFDWSAIGVGSQYPAPHMCKRCVYPDLFSNPPIALGFYGEPDTWGLLWVNLHETCPSYMPARTAWDADKQYFPNPYGEFAAWNSCPRANVSEY